MWQSRVVCGFLLVNLFISATAKFARGTISTPKDWMYLDRFCFLSLVGRFRFEISYPARYEIQTLYLYYDTADQWDKAYNSSLSCKQKQDLLDPYNSQILHLSPDAYFGDGSRCMEFERYNETWIRCVGDRSFFSMRPRWWYFAVGNCDTHQGLYFEYVLLMTNSNTTNRWFYHFSFDEFYSLPITIGFILLNTVLLVVSVVFAYRLRYRNLLHITFKLYLYAIIFEFAGLVLDWLHYDRFADDGVGFTYLLNCGLVLRQLTTIAFVALLLLMGKGYTITRAKLSSSGTLRFFVFMIVFTVLQLSTVVWAILVFDPAKVTYISESLPAHITLGLRVVACFWFLRASSCTISKYPAKKTFYCIFCLLMTLWFFSDPFVTILANHVLDNWVRAEVVHGVNSAVVSAGFIIFLTLTCPSHNNRFFPYHVRVNQITDCNFPQNVYEVQYISNPGENRNSPTDEGQGQSQDTASTTEQAPDGDPNSPRPSSD